LPFENFLSQVRKSDEAAALPQADEDVPSADAITFVYRHALQRKPDRNEIEIWSAQFRYGLSFQRFLLDVLQSDEAQSLPAPDLDTSSDAAVAFVYRHALRRNPSSDEIGLWSQHLQDGMSFPRLLQIVLSSEEARMLLSAEPEVPPETAIAFIYRHALGREPNVSELVFWVKQLQRGRSFQNVLLDIASSEEAKFYNSAGETVEDLSNGLFIAHLYETCLGRCALVEEILNWRERIVKHNLPRSNILVSFFGSAIRDERQRAEAASRHDPSTVEVMGAGYKVGLAEWKKRASELEQDEGIAPLRLGLAKPYVIKPNVVRVSAIASLYKGGPFIEAFLRNMTQQSLGENFELIIIDANSPDDEQAVIKQYQQRFGNIRYERMNYRIGIYDAWNMGVELARGAYLTNTNLDDIRRQDSLELQAYTLDKIEFADVVYQDFFYSFDPELEFSAVAAFGFKSSLPIVTPNNILRYNSPHNAPMWRKTLHTDIGMFDTSLKSAADHEFWMRCLQAGKIFYKINIPHVVYYQNPHGVSTRPGTQGVDEGMRILKKHGRKLISPYIYMEAERLLKELESVSGLTPLLADGLDPYAATQQTLLELLKTYRNHGEEVSPP
jgi:hypothetical protein